MSILKTPSRPSPPAVRTDVPAPSDARRGLGLVGNFRVTMAERAAKSRTARGLVEAAAETSKDIGLHAIEIEASQIKSALSARAVPALAAIQTNVVGSLAQAKNVMFSTWAEGLGGQIAVRHQAVSEMEAMAARGMLSADELAEAKAMIEQDAARDVAALREATDRAMQAIDAHAARATDHIARQSDKS